jgi:hypothetical protein
MKRRVYLRRHEDHFCSRRSVVRLGIVLRATLSDIDHRRGRRVRRITEPTAEQKSLLRQLGISLPEHLQINRECSADSAAA